MYNKTRNLMKKAFFLSLILSFSYYAFSQTKSSVPTLTEDGIYKIKGNGLEVMIDPKISGRVVSFKLDGKELLTSPGRELQNYGATFWSSPQLDWGWPPRPALDKNPYDAKVEGSKVILTSEKDTLLGYQFTKIFQLIPEDTAVLARYSIKNLSGEEKKVAGWEIHRVSTGGLSFFPAGADKAAPQSTLSVKNINNIIWYKSDPSNLKETHNKLFMHGREGWLGHVQEDLLFIKTFDDISLAEVPTKEEEVEIYTNTKMGYIELENQGPFTTLKPGESLEYEVKWYLRKLPASIKATEGNTKLVDYTRKVIK
jgi:hypothetical protein